MKYLSLGSALLVHMIHGTTAYTGNIGPKSPWVVLWKDLCSKYIRTTNHRTSLL